MLNKGSLQSRISRIADERRQARSRNLGGAVPPDDAVDENLLTPANCLEVALGIMHPEPDLGKHKPCWGNLGPNLCGA